MRRSRQGQLCYTQARKELALHFLQANRLWAEVAHVKREVVRSLSDLYWMLVNRIVQIDPAWRLREIIGAAHKSFAV
jgi:hypothetical protein